MLLAIPLCVVSQAMNPDYKATAPKLSLDVDGKEVWQFFHKNTSSILFQGQDLIQTVQKNRSSLESVNLSLISLTGVDLSETEIDFAIFHRTDLSNATLVRSAFVGATLTGANLSGSDLSKANLSFSDFDRSSLQEANLSNSNIFDTTFRGCNLSGANLSKASIWRSDFEGADLRGALFTGADFNVIWFEPAYLPEPESLAGVLGLRFIKVHNNFSPLEELRDRAYDRGLRGIGAELTCAIQRNKNDSPDRPWLRQFLSFYLFDATCAYGASPLRLLGLLGFLTFFHVLVVGWNIATESRDGRIRVAYNGKNGNKQVVYLARVLRGLGRKKSFEGRAWSLSITMFAVALLTVRVLFGRRLAEKVSNIFSKRPFVLVANGVLRIWVLLYVLGALYLVLLWAGSQYGRVFG